MLNKVQLIGRLGKDVEIRYTQEGAAIANLSLATNEYYKDKSTGERRDRTEWHRVVLFGRTAEIAGEYLKKGALAYVEGGLRTRKWEKDGVDHYTTEVVGNELKMLDRPSNNGGDHDSNRTQGNGHAGNKNHSQANGNHGNKQQANGRGNGQPGANNRPASPANGVKNNIAATNESGEPAHGIHEGWDDSWDQDIPF
jgi:single-strand DNA-binding protein